MKGLNRLILLVGLLLINTHISQAQTPSALRINVDASNSILAMGYAQTAPITQCLFSNCRLAVDASGNLKIVIVGGAFTSPFAGPDGTCAAPTYSFTSDTTQGLAKGCLTLKQGTITTDLQTISGTVTWNAAGVAFTGIKYVITDTASNSSSKAINILGGAAGTSVLFSVDKNGSGAFLANTTVPAGAGWGWNGRGYIIGDASSDGVVRFVNSGITAGVNVDFSLDGKFKLNTRSGGSVATQLAVTQTTVPTCTSANNCGTGNGVFATGSSDTAGSVTLGTTPASGFVITFNGTWTAAPTCNVWMNKAGMVTGKSVLTSVTSTTTITVVTNGTAPATGDIYAYHCIGVQ